MSKQENDALELLPLPPVTFHILLILAEGERHGYGIIQDVLAYTEGAMRIQPGTLYRSIQRMLEQGLIAERSTRPAIGEDDERRRYYRITARGRAVALAEARRLERSLVLARRNGLVPSKG